MQGPLILVRTMSRATRIGVSQRTWQYHSRSDNHSKTACWTVLFDLLAECDVFRRHASDGKIGFAVNHTMAGKIQKKLDLVVCRIPTNRNVENRQSFSGVGDKFGIALEAKERTFLEKLSAFHEERRNDVAEVLVALEAKACMTEHRKSLPRLFAEILATGYLAKQAAPSCLTVAYSVVNASTSFVTPSNNRTNVHDQPRDARSVVDMLGAAIPTSNEFRFGFDAIGVTTIACKNDGSPVDVVGEFPGPELQEHHHYERMIHGLCSRYRDRFGSML